MRDMCGLAHTVHSGSARACRIVTRCTPCTMGSFSRETHSGHSYNPVEIWIRWSDSRASRRRRMSPGSVRFSHRRGPNLLQDLSPPAVERTVPVARFLAAFEVADAGYASVGRNRLFKPRDALQLAFRRSSAMARRSSSMQSESGEFGRVLS